ncbi:MAG: class I SAM-dependent methyltransferase [Planctomycetaceae bacterium]
MFYKLSTSLARSLMEAWPNEPRPNDLSTWQVFQQDGYLTAARDEQDAVKRQSAQWRYDYETQMGFFDTYYPRFDTRELAGQDVLDLGCFTAGRLVNWAEKYRFRLAAGIDINPVFEDAGKLFAASKGVRCDLRTGFGEDLPWDDAAFDSVISFDVFEHVRDVAVVLQECYRVLKPGGRLFACFPPFYQPLEAHLGAVTKMPGLHWLFSGGTITAAFDEIIAERGPRADWYRRSNPGLAAWEKLPTLNGITVRRFRRILRSQPGWNVEFWSRKPVFSDGRRSRQTVFRLLQLAAAFPARLPLLEELFLGRICCTLQKAPSGAKAVETVRRRVTPGRNRAARNSAHSPRTADHPKAA